MDDLFQDLDEPIGAKPKPIVEPTPRAPSHKPSMDIDSPSAQGVKHKPSMEVGPANPRNTNKPSMNVDSPSAQRAYRVHTVNQDRNWREIARARVDDMSVGLVSREKYDSATSGGTKVGKQANAKVRLDAPLDISKKQVGKMIATLRSQSGTGEKQMSAANLRPSGGRSGGGIALPSAEDQLSKFPPILQGLDIDAHPLPVGTTISTDGAEENKNPALVATIRYVDGEWVSGWETPSRSGAFSGYVWIAGVRVQVPGTPNLYVKVPFNGSTPSYVGTYVNGDPTAEYYEVAQTYGDIHESRS